MSDFSQAVFLSYAREDAGAARRVAEALRAAGVEVWFDESELRGGDAWDAKIRRQIDGCTLFVPVISARTQERSKGYFRLEWKLAVDQTHLRAEGVPFLAPVVIDATREGEALVPPEFMRVQWTRLPDGLPTPQFVATVKQLLTATTKAPASRAKVAAEAPSAPGAAPTRPTWIWPVGALVALGLGAAAWIALRPKPAPASAPATAATPPAVAPGSATKAAQPAAKSIAVLPFANMSEEKDSAFFADGVHEDILTNLALVPDLKVVSRTTVTQYRDTKKTMRQIGEELGVAYILEGSVRRAGAKVRVTGQLINARTDEHVWAKSYDRDLTDIFAIQAALAQEIAGALSAAISPETRKFIDRRPTENAAAYDAYLQGRDTRNRSSTNSTTALDQAEKLFGRAVELDPAFAAAWGELAVVHALKIFWNRDASAARRAQGDAAIARAEQLAPEAPDVIRLVGTYAYYAHRDYARATAQYERIIKQQPNDPTGYASLGLIQRRQGRWTESLRNLQLAVDLDPANVNNTRNLLSSLFQMRHWPEARVMQARLLALLPGQLREELAAADYAAVIARSLAPVEAVLARLKPEEKESPVVLFYRKNWAIYRDDYEEFKRLDERQPDYPELSPQGFSGVGSAVMHLAHHNPAAARARVESLKAEMQALVAREPENQRGWLVLGSIEVILGHPEQGIMLVRKMGEQLSLSRDALDGASIVYWAAQIYALAGDKERALAELTRVLSVPSQYPVGVIEWEPAFHSLRGDPRFQALLNDPKNVMPF